MAFSDLQASCHTAAWSGFALTRSHYCNKPVTMPEIWQRTLATVPTDGVGGLQNRWNFTAWRPAAVVINLGTNVTSPPTPGLITSPAWVFCMSSYADFVFWGMQDWHGQDAPRTGFCLIRATRSPPPLPLQACRRIGATVRMQWLLPSSQTSQPRITRCVELHCSGQCIGCRLAQCGQILCRRLTPRFS